MVSASALPFTGAFSGITTRKMIDPNRPLRLLPELEDTPLARRNTTTQRSGIRMRDGYGVKSSAGTILSNGMFAVSFSFFTCSASLASNKHMQRPLSGAECTADIPNRNTRLGHFHAGADRPLLRGSKIVHLYALE
ncbi:hypothetical protein LP415_09310 [Polaromonas sp. P1(28)-8]|nr:hypothetical protein LP415_09310 [Polaromonas sp. P1(28)-8]